MGLNVTGLATVLLVEDNDVDVYVIGDAVDRCDLNLRLHVVKDGKDAVAYLRAVAKDDRIPCPALVLLDLNIPKVTGIEVLKEIRHGARCQRMPVIVVSSSDAPADREAAQRLGVEAYFRKPASLGAYLELCDVIKRVLPAAGHCSET